MMLGNRCLVREGNTALLGSCDDALAVTMLDATLRTAEASPAQWRDPESHHQFEHTLFTCSSSSSSGSSAGANEQQLLGGGAYTQYFLKIYGVALYAEAAAMAASPAMQSLRGQSADALRASGTVWTALTEATDFDKSLVLKLSLPVSSKMVVDALRNEFDLSEEQSVRTRVQCFYSSAW
jgi:hypothetical protein